ERNPQNFRIWMEDGNEMVDWTSSGFSRGDAIAFGAAFNIPVRISIHQAIPGPRSSDAVYSEEWK
ncbi:ATP-binding protein, partial [Escherichia coli]|nr:ATP-binding protein [Escherichia coli]